MSESRAVLSLALILSFRMLGLFLIYPVFAVYAPTYLNANTTLIGIALGSYGLTQAILQLPLSMLSDRIGRRPIIFGGLAIFALGSILAAITHNIYCLILARALQGAGAIGSTLMAFCADVTTPTNRTKSMALLGMTIGLSFALAMIIGPVFYSWFQLTGIFWLTAVLAVIGILILMTLPKEQQRKWLPLHSQRVALKQLLSNKKLLSLNLSIFIAHAILTAFFSVIPLVITQATIVTTAQWKIYLSVLSAAFLLTIPLLIISERKQLVKQLLFFAIALIGIAGFLFNCGQATLFTVLLTLFLFFVGFSLLEALLPSLVSKICPPEHKGSAMGLFSTCQFLGIFFGGFTAGLVRTYLGNAYIFDATALICIFWLFYLMFSFSDQTVETAAPAEQ